MPSMGFQKEGSIHIPILSLAQNYELRLLKLRVKLFEEKEDSPCFILFFCRYSQKFKIKQALFRFLFKIIASTRKNLKYDYTS